ncbi:TPA: hypothetical protein ACKP8A_001567 [Stenotrophomonas maltophilia]
MNVTRISPRAQVERDLLLPAHLREQGFGFQIDSLLGYASAVINCIHHAGPDCADERALEVVQMLIGFARDLSKERDGHELEENV